MKDKKLDERTKGHDCNRTLAGLNQNHMWLCMSSYAAVMAWPFNSVTNLLFLWKPQTINHGAQSGGRSWKFSTSSLSNDCACTGVQSALLLGAISEHNFHRKWGWGHLFYTIVAKPQRAQQDQAYIRPVVKWHKEKRELLSTFTAGGSLCAFLTHHPHSVSVICVFQF